MPDHKTLGLVETDMATLADAVQALHDLEGWLLSLPGKRRITAEDIMRLAYDLQRIGAGQDTTRKYLAHLHAAGWAPPNGRPTTH